MKKFIICILALTLLISFESREPSLIVKARVNRSFDTIWRGGIKVKIFDVNLSVINRTKNNLRFWTMTCSWMDTWTTNNTDYRFRGCDCDANFPKEFLVSPNDSISYHGQIIKRNENSQNKANDKVRLGLILIDTTADHIFFPEWRKLIDNKRKQGKIIWSNSLHQN